MTPATLVPTAHGILFGSRQRTNPDRIHNALTYARANLKSTLSIEKLARKFGHPPQMARRLARREKPEYTRQDTPHDELTPLCPMHIG